MLEGSVIFRVDSSRAIGSGHLMRCLTLAQELVERGIAVRFICRALDGDLTHLLEGRGLEVTRIYPSSAMPAGQMKRAAWPESAQREDAEQTLAAIGSGRMDWIVVDHYLLDAEWELHVRSHAKVFVMDDLANRRHACDLLLDQNYFGTQTASRYEGLVPAACVTLLGPQFALLRPEYRVLHRALPPRDGVVRRVLVFFGGSDSQDATSRVLAALSKDLLRELAVDVVIGVNHPNAARVAQMAAARPGTRIYTGLETLAGLMTRADLAIGAGGSTTWERACLGLPSLVEVVAANQREFSVALSADGYQFTLDGETPAHAARWGEEIARTASSPELLRQMSRAAFDLVDGCGTRRVAMHLAEGGALGRMAVRWRSRCGSAQSPAEEIRRDSVGHVIIEDEDGTCIATMAVRDDSTRDAGLIELGVPAIASSDALRAAVAASVVRGSLIQSGFVCWERAPGQHSAAPLRITLLTDRGTWLNAGLVRFAAWLLDRGYAVRWVHDAKLLRAGDACFILSLSSLVRAEQRALHRHNLVVHASDLPKDRGWSPMTWKILAAEKEIPVSLFEAVDEVDSGPIYLSARIVLAGTELIDEWRARLAEVTIALCTRWLEAYPDIVAQARAQSGEATYHARRSPQDSRLDPHSTIAQQFDLLRVVDNERYPAWFEHRGRRYVLAIRALDSTSV